MCKRASVNPKRWSCPIVPLLLGAILALAGPVSAAAAEQSTTLKETVVAALEYSPRLKVLMNNYEAIGHEKDRALGGYYPRIDLALGYGTESHNDEFRRIKGRENHFADRTEASLQLTQLLYDGDETGSRVGIEATVKVTARTGVEMEALTAVAAAGLTIYDMCKAIDRSMSLGRVRLVEKSGGRSGHYLNPEG